MRRYPHRRILALLTCLALLAGAAVACAGERQDALLRDLVATGTGREMYPSFDPDVHHYAVGCGEDGALTLDLSTAGADTRLEVDGSGYPNGDAVVELTGLAGDSDVAIALSDEEGDATYTVHCLPDDFPTITARKAEGASDFLIVGNAGRDYIAIFDTNGVPRFHRGAERSTNFKYHSDGRYPYSFFLRLERIPNFSDRNLVTKEALVLGEDFSVRDVVQTVPPLTHTDHHDFIIKPNGNYVLLSYEPSRRDLSAVLDADGNPYSVTEGTEDSVIQEITPEGEQVFLWNSWDHLAVVQDCTQHYFPDDYAHANSLQAVDGDIIASFRGCSQVLRIDGVSGEIIWILGKSNRSDADWIASGAPAPLKIVGDPHGEFCGQHSARLLPNGNLILFDNGDHCLEDPVTGMTERVNGAFSRVVEYSLDLETGQATFQRHHSLHGTFDRLAQRLGHVELMDNGNWLISWGDSPEDPAPALHPDESITEVDPKTGQELFSLVIADGDGNILTTRAFPLPPDALERDPALRELMATGAGREMYPPFDPDVHHYAVGCGEDGALTLALSTASADTRLEVNGIVRPGRDAVVELTGLAGDSDVVVDLREGERSATYTVHCLPDDFPTVTVRKSVGNSESVIAATIAAQSIAIIDTNGVPIFHRTVDTRINGFKFHKNGFYPYSYALSAGTIPGFASDSYPNREIMILDWDLKEVDIVQVIPPLVHTNAHDFVIKPNGNYVLMSYEPVQRDFSSFRDQDGNSYSTTEGTRDSFIQEITPEREQVFLWNSWDHLEIEDCVAHRFPDDYAHINSLELVDGDIVASFRGCSQVLRIDGTSGDIVWLLGRSNRSDADWVASGVPAPLKIVGDPYGEFCAQHSARLRPNGNLVLFDNGGPCFVDLLTGTTIREDSVFSRVVEYSLDPETGLAMFQRHHSLHGAFSYFTRASGHVELLDNGNWLISWGRGRDDDTAPDVSITEVDPLTGEELLTIVFTDGTSVLPARAYPLPADALERLPIAR